MNEKSIFKRMACPDCKRWEPDFTGKTFKNCPKCGFGMIHSDKWSVRYTSNGVTKTKVCTTRRQDAVDFLIATKDAIRLKKILPGEEKNKEIPWNTAKKSFMEYISSEENVSKRTGGFYQNCLNHLDDYFSGTPLNEIEVIDVVKYRAKREKVAAPATVTHELKTLKRMLSLHCQWYPVRVARDLHAVADDISRMDMPTVNNNRTRFLSVPETKLLMDKASSPALLLAIRIGLATGLRKANIMSLEWKQIDFIKRTITYQSEDMKSTRVFVSPAMEQIVAWLATWRKEQNLKRISPFVFPSPNLPKQPISDMVKSWTRTRSRCDAEAKKNGWPRWPNEHVDRQNAVVFHTLRHTFASHYLMNGGSLSVLSELMDHASIDITKKRYGHISAQHKVEAIDAFAGVFFSSTADR
jgi:integrase